MRILQHIICVNIGGVQIILTLMMLILANSLILIPMEVVVKY